MWPISNDEIQKLRSYGFEAIHNVQEQLQEWGEIKRKEYQLNVQAAPLKITLTFFRDQSSISMIIENGEHPLMLYDGLWDFDVIKMIIARHVLPITGQEWKKA
jgi:hypothetical protein